MEAAIAAGGAIDLPPASQALFVGRSYYGCVATVLPPLPTVQAKVHTHLWNRNDSPVSACILMELAALKPHSYREHVSTYDTQSHVLHAQQRIRQIVRPSSCAPVRAPRKIYDAKFACSRTRCILIWWGVVVGMP